MIYIRECKYCGREDLVLNCLRGLDLCGNCACNPRRVALQGHSKDGVAPPPLPSPIFFIGEAPGKKGCPPIPSDTDRNPC